MTNKFEFKMTFKNFILITLNCKHMGDAEIVETLRRRVQELGELNEGEEYATYVYITPVTTEDVNPRIYLPHLLEDALERSVLPEYSEYAHFRAVWDLVANHDYIRLTDGAPIGVLDLATVWLGVGMEMENKVPPFLSFALDIDEALRIDLLQKIIDQEIQPVMSVETSTNIIFTRINLINAALQLFPGIKTGLISQAKLYKNLTIINETFPKVKPLPAFDDQLKTVTYLFKLATLDEQVVTFSPTLDIDIFDNIRCSPLLPVCIRNGDELKTGKGVFKSVHDRMIKMDNRDESCLSRFKQDGFFSNSRSLSIVMYVYIGDSEEHAINAPRSDFVEVIYSFKKGTSLFNKFSVILDRKDTLKKNAFLRISTLMERLNRHMTHFKIIKPPETSEQMMRIKQRFIIPGVAVDKDVLLLFATADVTNSLLNFEEKESPWTQKKVLQFFMVLFGSVKMVFKPTVVTNSTMLVIDKDVLRSIVKGDHCIKVSISAQNLDQYNLARYIVVRFFANYVTNYDKYYALFTKVATRERLEPLVPIQNQVDETGIRNIKQLRVVDPELWSNSNYTRVAAPNVNLQVKPIKASDVEFYQKAGRQVILWPVKVHGVGPKMQTQMSINPATGKPLQIFYTTMTDENPFIVLVPNQGPNSATHPLIPKCQKTASGMIVHADWSITLSEREKNVFKGKKKTLRPLAWGESGTVTGSITSYLGTNTIVRFGVSEDPSSFVHCILLATSSPGDNYRKNGAKDAAEMAIEVRKSLGEYATACMQENPGKSPEQIREEIINPRVYLDPKKYYRACEEMFGVNIFIGTPDGDKDILITPPNFAKFSIRTKRRPLVGSIVVIRLPMPHVKDDNIFKCEVLASFGREKGFIFNDEVTELLEGAMNKITMSLKVRPSCQIESVENGFAARQYISVEPSTINTRLSANFLSKIEAQKVDNFGKCRGIKMRFSKGKEVWLVTPPIEPLSGPNWGDDLDTLGIERATSSFPLEEIKPIEFEKLLLLVPNLEEVGIDKGFIYVRKEDSLVGIWTKLGEIELYIPLVPSKWSDKYQPVRFNIAYHVGQEESPTEKLQRLQRVVTIMIQMMKRLYVRSGKSAADFVKSHMVVITPTKPMTTKGGKRMIPLEAMTDFDLLLEHFVTQFPTLFHDRKLLCDTEEYYTNLKRRLEWYEHMIESERLTKITELEPLGNTDRLTKFPPYLEHFFVTVEDFSVHSDTQLLFLSTARLELELKIQEDRNFKTVTKIEPSMVGRTAPFGYLYSRDGQNALFLVQNVMDGDVSRAATVAAYWSQNKVNLGYHAPPIIGNAGIETIPAENIKIDDPFKPMVLLYQTGEACALLSLNEP